jgi:hypothetical protein
MKKLSDTQKQRLVGVLFVFAVEAWDGEEHGGC